MALALGIDTGGTFTDAVIVEAGAPRPRLLAKAKAPTTHGHLQTGIGAALRAVLAHSAIDPGRIGLVSLSTTLATNALVEGRGQPVALFFIGFDPSDADHPALTTALGPDPLFAIAGGHGPEGQARAPLDIAALDRAIAALPQGLGGVAIVGRFGVRNPAHEASARAHLRAATGLPVSTGHELSAALNGPRRAATAVMNARLIGPIQTLIEDSRRALRAEGLACPLTVVRGDGALMAAETAALRPIETILSGPAASLVGAAALTGATDAVIADIGGTTTDIAVLRGGRPRLGDKGAEVGGQSLLVEAAEIATVGLGGDSRVAWQHEGTRAQLSLGPRRVVPLAFAADRLGPPGAALLGAKLERQLADPRPHAAQGTLLWPAPGFEPGQHRLPAGAADLVAALSPGTPLSDQPVDRQSRHRLAALIAAGGVVEAGFTPTDAAHVLGHQTGGDAALSALGAALLARQKDPTGRPSAEGPTAMAQATLTALAARSSDAILAAALSADGRAGPGPADDPTLARALAGHQGAAFLKAGLALPLIGLGASAPLHHPAVAERLSTTLLLPEDGDVANAIGAVAGLVRARATRRIAETAEGRFSLTGGAAPTHHASLAAAQKSAEAEARAEAEATARARGAGTIDTHLTHEETRAEIDGRPLLIEATVTAEATGRPRFGAAEGVGEPGGMH